MLALGVPPHLVVANDVSANTGTALSGAYVFRKNKFVLFDIVKFWLPGILLGPIIGANLLSIAPSWLVEKLILAFCMGGAAWMVFNPKILNTNDKNLPENWKIKSVFFSLIIGMYFGFSGAGAGTLSTLILVGPLGLSLKQALGTRKVIHIPIHLISMASYYALGLIKWELFSVMFTACLIAGWTGSHIAIKTPDRVLRPLFFSVVFLLAGWVLLKGSL